MLRTRGQSGVLGVGWVEFAVLEFTPPRPAKGFLREGPPTGWPTAFRIIVTVPIVERMLASLRIAIRQWQNGQRVGRMECEGKIKMQIVL